MAEVLSLSVGTARNLRHGEHVLPDVLGVGKNLQHFFAITTRHAIHTPPTQEESQT